MKEIDDSTAAAKEDDALLALVTRKLSVLSDPLTKDTLWSAVAGSHSDEWLQASIALKKAEHPNNQPLGLIERALESDEERNTRADTLAWFTAVNEELQQDSHLRGVFDMLATRYNVLETSLKISHEIAEETEKLSLTFGLSALKNLFPVAKSRKSDRKIDISFLNSDT